MFVGFLDCSKAFYTISHYGVFVKLIERNVSLCFLQLIIYLYLNMQSRCIWRGAFGDYFDMSTGIKSSNIYNVHG